MSCRRHPLRRKINEGVVACGNRLRQLLRLTSGSSSIVRRILVQNLRKNREQAVTPRARRTRSYWEPIYEPKLVDKFPVADWIAAKEQGSTNKTLIAENLKDQMRDLKGANFKGIKFTKCDFFGKFSEIENTLVFKDCEFESCDFGLSTWRRAKFSGCTFRRCSLTQSTWLDCEFRDCHWEDIGLSGNETILDGTYISNPEKIVSSTYLNLDEDVLSKAGKTRNEQILRCCETKSVVSRNIYNQNKLNGDEEAFYEACRVYARSNLQYSYAIQIIKIKDKEGVVAKRNWVKIIYAFLEMYLIEIIALVNGWGARILRPLFVMIGIWIIFSITYIWSGGTVSASLFKSLDITLVAGYTRAVSTDVSKTTILECVHLFVSIFVYTIFFGTIVARISKVR